ncbi:MAG: L-serine ammonia-lyase, partial [Burkholderiales bacterium]|nr:L-serine ammonia-lyase [Burkholderiales bacterium]
MISIFDLFKIGIGPSSSHTVGPMKAAAAFMSGLAADGRSESISGLRIRLFGSLACTGKGHCTDKAVTLGVAGHAPDTVDPDEANSLWAAAQKTRRLQLPGGRQIDFDPARDIVFDTAVTLPRHSNALKFSALDEAGRSFAEEVWYSVGGGFIVRDGDDEQVPATALKAPFPFRSALELLAMCRKNRSSIAEIVLVNELSLRTRHEIDDHIGRVANTMFSCIDRGMSAEGM